MALVVLSNGKIKKYDSSSWADGIDRVIVEDVRDGKKVNEKTLTVNGIARLVYPEPKPISSIEERLTRLENAVRYLAYNPNGYGNKIAAYLRREIKELF